MKVISFLLSTIALFIQLYIFFANKSTDGYIIVTVLLWGSLICLNIDKKINDYQ